MATLVTFAIYSAGGAPATGASPAFAAYKDANGNNRAQPTIHEIGGGLYGFTSTDPDDLAGTAYLVSTGQYPAYYGGAVGNLIAWALYNASGTPFSGAIPVFIKYVNEDGGDEVQPTINNLGDGLFGFVPTTDDIQQGRAYLISSGSGAYPEFVAGTVDAQPGFVPVPPTQVPVLSADAPALEVSATTTSVARDLYLDPNLRELGLLNGDLVIVRDLPAIAQDINMRLCFVRGEWFLDESVGVDYFGRVFVKGARRDDLALVFREALLATPGVAAVQSLSLNIDASRRLTVNWTVSTDLGELQGTTQAVS